MTIDANLFAALSLASVIAGVICGNVRGRGFMTLQESSNAILSHTHAPSFRALSALFLGLSFLLALLAGVGIWHERGGFEGASERTYPSAWGALWVYALLLLIEWRTTGLSGVGRRILVGAFLAGMGVLALGVGFEVWLEFLALPLPACEVGSPVIKDDGLRSTAALGLTLALIAGPALRLLPLADLPLSTIAASVALATWMQPALPALGWLPTAIGAGAPLALLLFVGLWLLVRLCTWSGPAGVLGFAAYLALGVGGSAVLETL